MSLLTMMQRVARRLGLASPSSVISSADVTILQLLELANEEGETLARRGDWPELIEEATWTTLAAELQGAVATLAPGFNRIINDTIWIRDLNHQARGPVSPQRWQAMKGSNVTGPYSEYRIRAGNLYLIPAPAASQTGAFEFVSERWCQSSDGLTKRSSWAADSDTGRIPEDVMRLGIIWRWLEVKGMEYAEEFRNYEIRADEALGRQRTATNLWLGRGPLSGLPMPNVPEGSWPSP